jgi:pilus assembly protein CpaE
MDLKSMSLNDASEARKKILSGMGDNPESVSMRSLSVVLLGADEQGRRSLSRAMTGTPARIVREAPLPGRDALPQLLAGECDVLIVDLNYDAEHGLELVEAACGLQLPLTVMVYSRRPDPDLLVRCMRAGARELFTDALSAGVMAEALVRASVRREELRGLKKTRGKLLIFAGAKGGSGVTTIAANFAVALAQESGQSVGLVDLNLQLGDAALNLGLKSDFSTLDALQNERRLDSDLVSKLLMRHDSGLQVLAAPDHLTRSDQPDLVQPGVSGVMKLMEILRGDFAWVVVDAGSYSPYAHALFESAEKVYLVSQVSVAELRNSHRMIDAYFEGDARQTLEVVLNRFALRAGEIDEASVAGALMLPSLDSSWKIPNGFQEVRDAQNTATALIIKGGPVARVISEMARAACGKTPSREKKRRFGLFSR